MTKEIKVLLLRKDTEFSGILRSAGCAVTELQLISTEPLEDLGELFQSVEKPDQYDGAIFTSEASAHIFIKAVNDRLKSFNGRIYVLGARANAMFADAGLDTVFDRNVNTVDEMIDKLGSGLYGKRFLYVRGERSLRKVPDRLRGRSVVDEVIVYRTVVSRPAQQERDAISNQLSRGEIKWLCFFSPSAVDAFYEIFGQVESARAAAIGITTAKRAEELGFTIGFVSPSSSSSEFASAFASHLNGN
jgi:uroporphyrinogen-III synthase